MSSTGADASKREKPLVCALNSLEEDQSDTPSAVLSSAAYRLQLIHQLLFAVLAGRTL